jgi:hypothetical protein
MFILFAGLLSGQTLPENIIKIIEESAEEGVDTESLVNEFERMALRRPALNKMSRKELEATGVFSIFQLESLLDYRKEYGDILSLSELSVVDGFDGRTVALCGELFSFGTDLPPGIPQEGVRGLHTATVKLKKNWAAEGFGITSKYEYSQGKNLCAGVTIDSDAGEKLSKCLHPDFTSAHFGMERKGVLKKIVAGDYSARFGQGLVLWKSFGISAFGDPSASAKKENGLTTYSSTDETNFFRGAGVELSVGRLSMSAFASAGRVDARIVGDTAYTSIVTGGYHRTEAEIAKRRTMTEYVVGTNSSYEIGRWRFGLTALAYAYDKKNGRRVQEYNKYQMYDGIWGNLGFDFYGSYRKFRFFGEAAVDLGLSPAALAGVIWNPIYGFDVALTGRWYSKSYIATHSGAYSSLSTCSNQRGALLSVRYLPTKCLKLSLNADYVYCPWPRYRIDGPSWILKSRLSAEYSFPGGSMTDIQVRYSGSAAGGVMKVRLNTRVTLSDSWSVGARVEANNGGWGCFMEGTYKSQCGKFEASARLTFYDTDGWDSRIYFYERDVPQSFGIQASYGKGTGEYLVLRYSPAKYISMWLKCSQNYSAFFIRILIPG